MDCSQRVRFDSLVPDDLGLGRDGVRIENGNHNWERSGIGDWELEWGMRTMTTSVDSFLGCRGGFRHVRSRDIEREE